MPNRKKSSVQSARCLMIAVFFTVLLPASAHATFTICNQSEDRLVVASIEEKRFLVVNWTSYGWVQIKPNKCEDVVWYGSPHRLYLSIRQIDKDGNRRLVMQPPGKRSTNYRTIERFFCVGNKPFERKNIPLSQHEKCPNGSDWFLQLFNVYYDISANTNFTLDVK